MPETSRTLASKAQQRFGDGIERCVIAADDCVTLEIARDRVHEICRALHDEPGFSFRLLIDICGVDYLTYGDRLQDDGIVAVAGPGGEVGHLTRDDGPQEGPRFAVVYHLLSVENNQRIRLRAFLDDEAPRVKSVVDIWNSANWYEREAFDLFGILFDDHPDLRRLLTDYGFVGHPFRKDFPISGNVEMRYDPERRRVIYEPVSIEPRINVPRIIRRDHRYFGEEQAGRKETGRG